MAISVAAAILNLVALAGRLRLLDDISSGAYVSFDDATASDDLVRVAVIIQLAALAVTGLAFLMWLHRVVANNWAMRIPGMRFTPGWAVGWWFIPIVSLFRPVQVVAEAWRATGPADPEAPDRHRRTGLLLIGIWWTAWVLGNLLGLAARDTSTTVALRTSTLVNIAGSLANVVGAVLAVVLVLTLTSRQERRAAQLGIGPDGVVSHAQTALPPAIA